MIPYGRQEITDSDISAVTEVLRSDYLTQGPAIPLFEKAIAAHVGSPYALAVNSATSALHMACLALGLGPGDWLWTSPISFVASANCGLYCGAKVDFVDIDAHSYNMCPKALRHKLEQAEKTGKLPKIVVPVHLSGQACDMEEIHRLAQQYGFRIIEDASHAVGGKYRNAFIGNCQYSDITVFSFHPVKIITTGEGGMALTRDAGLFNKMNQLRSHGITREASEMSRVPDGPWYYEQVSLGYNFRMTDVQAALGYSQASRLDDYVARRHAIAARYNALLAGLPLVTPWQHPDSYSGLHLYIIRLRSDLIQKSHKEVFEYLRQNGIGVQLHYIPIHLQPHYQRMGFAAGDFPEAENYYREAISLPLYPTLSVAEQDQVIRTLQAALAPRQPS